MALLLVGGWWTADWRAKVKDSDMRAGLLQQAAAIARTINPEQVKKLSFTAADKANPDFMQLCEQMAGYQPVAHCRSIHTLALRNGELAFGPESYAETDPEASPPGTIYEQPTRIRDIFKTGRPLTEGPYTDEYGTLVSAFTPVLDPRSGEVLMVVRLDIEARDWQTAMTQERFKAGLCALAPVAILLVGLLVLRWRKRLLVDRQGQLRYAEAYLMAAFGLASTLITTLAFHDNETRSRQTVFSQLAEAQVKQVMETLGNLKENQLGGLARFYEGSQAVEPDEFHTFARTIPLQGGMQALAWIPSVSAAGKGALETQAVTEGFKDFTVWQYGTGGRREPAAGREVYYPVWRVEPLTGNEAALGYDLGSEPARRAALNKAIETGLPSATDPLTLVQAKGSQTGSLVIHPVFSGKGETKTLRGFAVAVLRIESLLQLTLASMQVDEGASVVVDMLQLQSGEASRFLASSSSQDAQLHAPDRLGKDAIHLEYADLCGVYPFFIFDKSYALMVHPGPAFLAAHQMRARWISALVGVLFTSVLTAFAVSMTRRRSELEAQVQVRTAELQQSESKFRTLFEDSGDAALLVTDNGMVMNCNKATLSMFRARREQIVGHYPDEVSPQLQPDGRPSKQAAAEKISGALAGGGARFEWVHRRFDGSEFWAEMVLTALPLDDRRVLFVSLRDITDRKHAEDALRTSKAELDLALRSAQMGAWHWDLIENQRCFDDQVCRTLGIYPETFTGTAEEFFNAVHPDDREKVKAALRRTLEQGVPYEPEYRVVWSDGSIHHIAARGTVVHDDNGRPVRLNGIILDITVRKRAEEAAAALLLRNTILLQTGSDGIHVLDKQGQVVEVNDSFCRMLGYTRDELLRLNMADWETQTPAGELTTRIAQLVANPTLFETRYRTKDGRIREIEVNARGVRLDNHVHLYASARDITERKQMEQTLRESEERFRQIMHSLQVGIILVDAEDHRIVDANHKALEMTGSQLGDLVGAVCHQCICPAEKGRCPVTDLGQKVQSSERTLLTVSGRSIQVLKTVLLVRIGGRDTLVESFVDISQMKETEDKLAAAREVAEEANRVKSEFLANMSHEIRTPMTAILGYADLISEGCPVQCAHGGHSLRDSIATIRRNGEHLLGLINNILDLSKIEAEKMSIEPVACSLHQIVTEVTSLVRVQAMSKGLRFDTEFIGNVPETIRTDPLRVRQILINLLGNAIKFTKDGGVRLLVRFVTEDSEPRMQFDVIDTGIGMTQEQAGKIFVAFSQADTSTTRQFGGTGLGLLISKRLAQTLGGDVVVVDTQPGLGTRFRATVAVGPLDGVRMIEGGSIEAASANQHKTSDGPPSPVAQARPLEGFRILLAEDGPDNQRLIVHVLKKAGATVEVAENGQIAIDKALAAVRAGQAFDVILMDMQMPEMDGYDATGRLRAADYHGPIIALTAHAMASDQQKCLEAGCDDYASKPIDRPKLIQTIQNHI